ncbi:Sialic acid TRAP transporter large permease protein SiaM [subsurface metagenome]
MSGAAVADAGGLGAIEIKVMKEKGYDMDFRDAITIASSTIGPIIPPSVPMVIYGTMAQASTGALFLGGLIPGLLMGFSLMTFIYFISKKRDYYVGPRANFNEIWISFKDAFLSLLTPIIIVGGIIFGIFTPTEAAVVASAYALILGTLVYRTLSWDNIKEVLLNTIITSSTIILIIAFASPFSWLLASDGVSKRIMELVFSISTNPIIILLILNIFFLIIGMFLEAISVMVIVIPVLLPLVKILGIDPVHFGVVMVLNLMIGLATPPFGLSLFTIAKLEKIEPYKIYKPCLLFSIPLIIVLLLITYVPGLVLWLPRLLSLG